MNVHRIATATVLVAAAGILGACAHTTTHNAPGSTTAPAVTSSAPVAATAPRGLAIDKDGTYRVGADVAPGTYKATVPANSPICYWARLRDFSGAGIIDNAPVSAGGQALVTIAPSDAGFTTTGCGHWTKVG